MAAFTITPFVGFYLKQASFWPPYNLIVLRGSLLSIILVQF